LTLVALTLVFVFFVAPYWLADAITTFGTRPMDLELTSSPADFEIEFEDVAFSSTDGVPLKGWYLGGGDRGASIVCSHGLFRSRREVLDRAVLLRKAGFNVLLADFRRHGKSGGDRVTLGFKERLDVEGAIRFLQDRNPHDRILLFGVSMGAAASLLAAAESLEVRLVIADSSFLSFEHTVTHHLKLFFGLPRFPLADELIFFIERRAGFQKENFDLEKAVAEIGDRPILFIAGGEDERTPIELQRRLYQAAKSPLSRLVIIDGATHGAAYRTRPEAYREALLGFLAEVMGPPPLKGQ
jgi:fermentation-respiration switch protein FrsA (DUF1100 family)